MINSTSIKLYRFEIEYPLKYYDKFYYMESRTDKFVKKHRDLYCKGIDS